MIRTWLSTAVAVLAVAVPGAPGAGEARADGPAPEWNPVPAAPAPAPLSVKPPAGAPADMTQWVPAAPPPTPAAPVPVPVPAPKPATTTVDAPEFRSAPAPPALPVPLPPAPAAPVRAPLPAPVPAPPPQPPAPEFRAITVMPEPAVAPRLVVPPPSAPPFVPSELPPVKPEPVKQLLPSHLPALAIPRMPGDQEEPTKADPKKDPMSEPLPPPRPIPSLTPPAQPIPPSQPGLTVNPAGGVPLTDTRPALDPAPNLPGTLNGVPARGKVFGSPSLRLSRDYSVRDLLGYDMAKPVPSVAGGVGLFGDGADGPPTDNFFVEAEYLLWWANRPRIPLLATTSNGTGPGFVGQPGTANLLGPGTFGRSFHDGLRVRAGGWLDDCSGHGFDASFFFLGRRAESVTLSGLPVLTRPFFAPNFDAEFGEVVALPNLSTGSLRVETDSFLWGADINYRCAVCRTCDRTSAWFAGYRHLNLAETLSMTEDITASGALATDPVGTRVLVGDRFRTHNRFHGGQVGWLIEQRYGRWEVGLRASLALGVTVQTLEIDGFQERTRPGQATQFFNGGLLATGPNLGKFDSTRFSVVPEATVNLGYSVTPNFQVTVGYNFLYWNNVIRPGDQIDRTVDVSLVPNPPAGVAPSGQNRPLPTFTQSDFWTQGITFGVRYRW